MFFKKKTHLVGLDIGSSTIKAAEVIATKSGNTLHNFGILNIAPGIIEEGTIRDHGAVSAAIRELFSANNIKNKNVAISIGGYSVIVKKISVQTITEDELQETIHFEAEQYIPFDISDVNLDFQILGENEQNPNQMDVLLVAAKKEMVGDYIHLVELAGLHTVIIDIDAFALQNIFEFNYATEEESIALIDIGASKTSLNILKGYSSVFMRDVSLGCGQINQQIVSQADCSIEEAEEIKHSEQPKIISAEDLANIVTSIVSDWTTEIRRAIDFFYSTYPDDHISKIILSGGGANIVEFRQLLADEISTEVEIINPFDKFSIESSSLDSSYLEKIAPQAAICMGLAIRKVD